MSHDVIYFPSEECFSDGGLVCPMDPSEPSESIFVHRSQIVSIGHIWKIWDVIRLGACPPCKMDIAIISPASLKSFLVNDMVDSIGFPFGKSLLST